MALETPAFLPSETLVSPLNSMYCRSASRLMSFTQSLLSMLSERIREANALLVTSQLYPNTDTYATPPCAVIPACQRTTPLSFVSVADTVLLAPLCEPIGNSVAMTVLADLIRKAAGGASNRTIAAQVGVSPETLSKIAAAYQIPTAALRSAVGLPEGGGRYTPPPEADLLDERQRKALDELIRSVATASPRFELFRGRDGHYYFSVKRGAEIVATSAPFSSEKALMDALAFVKGKTWAEAADTSLTTRDRHDLPDADTATSTPASGAQGQEGEGEKTQLDRQRDKRRRIPEQVGDQAAAYHGDNAPTDYERNAGPQADAIDPPPGDDDIS